MAFFDTTWYINYGNGSSTGYYAIPTWIANHSYAAGTFMRPLTTPAVGSERCFVCIIAGTSSNPTEPTWTTTRGAKTTDTGATWQECTGMPGPCGDTTNCVTWVASTAYTLGEMIYDSVSGALQILSTAGTSKSGSPPSFSATAGTTTADNTCTWTSLGLASGFSAFANPHARLANALASTWGAAGNNFAIASNHAETQSSAMTITSPGAQTTPIGVYCISSSTTLASPTLATTASISTTGNSTLTLATGTKFSYFYGVIFNFGDGNNAPVSTFGGSAGILTLENCGLNIVATAAGATIYSTALDPSHVVLINCAITLGATTQSLFQNNSGNQQQGITMLGGSIAASGSVPTTAISSTQTRRLDLVFRDVDLSAITGNLFGLAYISGTALLQNCKLGAGVTVYTGSLATSAANSPSIKLHNCDSANTNYRYYLANGFATVQQETTIVRTGSLATNGTTPISWNITTTANSKYIQPFVSEDISIWNDLTGSVLTITLYLISGTTLNNNDFWAEVELLGTSSFPLGTTVSSRMTPLATAAALTSDTSTWGGSTNKYKIVLSVTPQSKGPIKVRFYAAKASSTTYVDPIIYLTDSSSNLKSIGRSFFIPGFGYCGETAPSFMRLGTEGNING